MRISALALSALMFGLPLAPALRAANPAPAPAAGTGAVAEEPQIKGIEIARAGGGFLGVTLEGVRLRVTFYDKDKLPVAPDAVRIAARWDHPRETGGMKSTVLTPGGADSLISPGLLRPPHTYNVTLVLVGADDIVIEQHVVNLGAMPAPAAAAASS